MTYPFIVFKYFLIVYKLFTRVYLKTGNMTNSEGFFA